MSLAQKLYEGVELGDEGSVALITYMRTDSVHVSNDALIQVRELIPERFGSNYLPEKPNYYKSKKDAQEAHEAVVPPTPCARRKTSASISMRSLQNCINSSGSALLLRRCFQRFSIRRPSTFPPATTLSGYRSVQKFDGYLRVYQMPASIADREDDEKDDEGEGRSLPQVVEGQTLRLDKNSTRQHFTEPPPRFKRCDAGEGARRRRHRRPLDLCFDQFSERLIRLVRNTRALDRRRVVCSPGSGAGEEGPSGRA